MTLPCLGIFAQAKYLCSLITQIFGHILAGAVTTGRGLSSHSSAHTHLSNTKPTDSCQLLCLTFYLDLVTRLVSPHQALLSNFPMSSSFVPVLVNFKFHSLASIYQGIPTTQTTGRSLRSTASAFSAQQYPAS